MNIMTTPPDQTQARRVWGRIFNVMPVTNEGKLSVGNKPEEEIDEF